MLIGRTGKEEVVCVFDGIFIAVWQYGVLDHLMQWRSLFTLCDWCVVA